MEEAIRLIDRGVLLDYALYPCERFEGAARAVICFTCGKWGHKAAFCKEKARCLICACEAHGQEGTAREREARCPVRLDPTRKPKCINCGGAHAAFDASCKVAKERRQRARERFLDRPLTFQAPPSRAAAAAGAGGSRDAETAGGSQIRVANEERPRKRPAKAGRPSDIARAGQNNGSNLFNFLGTQRPPGSPAAAPEPDTRTGMQTTNQPDTAMVGGNDVSATEEQL